MGRRRDRLLVPLIPVTIARRSSPAKLPACGPIPAITVRRNGYLGPASTGMHEPFHSDRQGPETHELPIEADGGVFRTLCRDLALKLTEIVTYWFAAREDLVGPP